MTLGRPRGVKNGSTDLAARPKAYVPQWHRLNEPAKLALLWQEEEDAKPARLRGAKRTCLGCAKRFESSWAGNRICETCTGRDSRDEPIERRPERRRRQ